MYYFYHRRLLTAMRVQPRGYIRDDTESVAHMIHEYFRFIAIPAIPGIEAERDDVM
jgi:hypothetical protein